MQTQNLLVNSKQAWIRYVLEFFSPYCSNTVQLMLLLSYITLTISFRCHFQSLNTEKTLNVEIPDFAVSILWMVSC